MDTSFGEDMRVRFGIESSSYSARINWYSAIPGGGAFYVHSQPFSFSQGIHWCDFMVLAMESGSEDDVNNYIGDFTESMSTTHRMPGLLNCQVTLKGVVINVGGHGHFSAPKDREDLLHVAASTGMQRAAFAFLSRGADPNALDHLGRTPLQVAKTPIMRSLLISAGAKEPAAAVPESNATAPSVDIESARKLGALKARLAAMTRLNARLRETEMSLRESNKTLSETIAHMASVKRTISDTSNVVDAQDESASAKRWKAEIMRAFRR